MSNESGYYRHPTIHGDTIVFVSEDDLWTVPADGRYGAPADREPGTITFPAFSPGRRQDRFHRPGRRSPRGLRDGRARRRAAPADLARHDGQVAGWRPDGDARPLRQRLAPALHAGTATSTRSR